MQAQQNVTPIDQAREKADKPEGPGQWTLKQIQTALKRQIPARLLKSKSKGGAKLTFLPWYSATRILDKYCPGWVWEIRQTQLSSDRLFVVGRLTIPTANGLVYREATGTENLKEERFDKREQVTRLQELAYGDPSSNAESMAFRRAAARFGLGLYLYEK